MLDKPNGNWIKLSRELFFHEIANDKPWNRTILWVYLIAMASTGERVVQFRGHDYFLKRGQLSVSLGDLEERTGWSRDKVRFFFRYLKRKEMATTSGDSFCTVVSILNYDKWQGNICQGDIRQNNTIASTIANTIASTIANDSPEEDEGCTSTIANTIASTIANTQQNKNVLQEVSSRGKEKNTEQDSVVTQKRMNQKVPLLTFDPSTQSVVGEREEARQRFAAAFPRNDFDMVMEKMRVWIVKKGNPHKTYWKTLCTIASGEVPMKKMSDIGKSNMGEEWG